MKNLSMKKSILAGLAALVLSVSTVACGGTKKCTELDTHFDSYRKKESKVDSDGDGEIDTIWRYKYDCSGRLIKKTLDIITVNGDFRRDVEIYEYGNYGFSKGMLTQETYDKYDNGKVDSITTYKYGLWGEVVISDKLFVW